MLVWLLTAARMLFAQEAMINDIKSCRCSFLYSSYYLIKQIRKEKDTLNYYYDPELIIYFNRKKYKDLKDNTFYIINHGFNKVLTFEILSMEIEVVDPKTKKGTVLGNPPGFVVGFYEDSLRRASSITFNLNFSEVYKNAIIRSMYTRIEYYDRSVYRWFVNEGPVMVASRL